MNKSMSAARRGAVRVESLETRALCSLSFAFDYRYDTSGFFASQARKDVLVAAGRSVSARLADRFSAVAPGGGNTWSLNLTAPGTGKGVSLNNPTVAANTITVFVGARELPSTTLGQGGPTGWGASGTTDWINLVRGRGQSGAVASPRTDFAPKAGAIAFDTSASWFFGATTSGLATGQNDFFSVAAHELGHVLGLGAGSETWPKYVSGNTFNGPKAKALYGGPVPLNSDNAHFAEGVQFDGLEAAMDPTIRQGTRKLFTELDFAALDDIGYDVTARPVPTTGTISGTAFWDVDRDGKRSPNEYGYNVRVYLDLNKNGTYQTSEPSRITDSKGNYTFADVKTGTYRVRESIPNNFFRPSVPGSGYYDVTVAGGKTTTVAAFANVKTASAGTGDVIGTLFNDTDGDGTRDSGEAVLSGWRVFFDNNKNGRFDSASEVGALTDAYGEYVLTAAPGTYRFAAVKPGGYRATTPAYYDLAVGRGTLGVRDYGFTTGVLFGGLVFADKDGDGAQDKGEVGLKGLRVFLDADKDGKWDANEGYVWTDSGGNFQFKARPAGTYRLRVEVPKGYAQRVPSAGYYTFTLAAAATKSGLNFALKPV